MLNTKIAKLRVHDGVHCAVTRRSRSGHAIFGPYERRPRGFYCATFSLGLFKSLNNSPDQICASLEIVNADNDATLERRDIYLSQLGHQAQEFAVEFLNLDLCRLEYRVFTTGAHQLAVGLVPKVTFEKEAPPVDNLERFGIGQGNLQDLQDNVRAVMRLIKPVQARDVAKTRIGRVGDGGYVQLDDFSGVDTALSLGINDEVSWDEAVADRGLTIYQFDHTVEAPHPHDKRMIFAKEMISDAPGPGVQTLEALIDKHDRGDARPNLMLKMDIECAEWKVFQATSTAKLGRFSQIVCEFHALQNLWNPDWQRGISHAFEKLLQNYGVVHVHGNISGGVSVVAGVPIPNVLEITFANREIYDFEPSTEMFPGALDVSCSPSEADLYLGRFEF